MDTRAADNDGSSRYSQNSPRRPRDIGRRDDGIVPSAWLRGDAITGAGASASQLFPSPDYLLMDDAIPLRFDRFEVRSRDRQLLRDGVPLVIGARAFDLLLALVERCDRVVTKTELLDLVWPNLVVEENNLQVQISALRKLLGSQAIVTIPGRGYRFTAALMGAAQAASMEIAPIVKPTSPGSPVSAMTNLPRELPPLYGREEELRTLRSLIASHRLVTIVGAGGIGKSRLAQAAAHSLMSTFPDGAWMVELAGLFDPALLPNVVFVDLGYSATSLG